jgi:hypothetical protein
VRCFMLVVWDVVLNLYNAFCELDSMFVGHVYRVYYLIRYTWVA